MDNETGAERATLDLWPTVARMLGLSKNSVYAAAHRKEIPGLFRIGTRFLVKRDVFLAFLAPQSAAGAKPIAGFPVGMETR